MKRGLLFLGALLLAVTLPATGQVAQLTITSGSPLPSGVVYTPYSFAFQATGGIGSRTWFVIDSAPPPGLSLSNAGVLSGTPTTVGTFKFYVRVSDAQQQTYTRPFELTIGGGATAEEPPGMVGQPYQARLVALAGTSPYTWSILSGALPRGLVLNRGTGVISGEPTLAGTFSFTVQWVDVQQLQGYPTEHSIRIYPALTITSSSPLPAGVWGTAYSQQIGVTGGRPPYSATTTGSLPPGLRLDPSTLVIGGTPAALGTFTFRLTVADGIGTVEKEFSITVASVTITGLSPSSAIAGAAGFTLTVSGSNFVPPPLSAAGPGSQVRWKGTPIPTSYVSSTQLQATVSAQLVANAGSATVDVLNPNSAVSNSLTFTILAPLAITTASPLPAGTVAAAYSQTLAATGGISPYTWSISSGALPPGLSLGQSETQSVTLSGTPTQAGAYNFTVSVTDSRQASATKAFTLTVSVPQAPTLSVTGLTDMVNPAQQPSLDVQLSSAYVLALTGTIRLAFTPDAVAPSDDPSIQFSSGGRTLSFTIPAGQTRAFPTSPPAIQTGTVAGRIDLTLQSLQAGGQDITPTTALLRSVQIARSAPTITSVQVVNKTSSGFTVRVTGYSTPRQVTQAVFTFAPSSGGNLGTTQLTVPVDAAFTTWFTGTASGQFGSSFLYTQPFQVQGALTDIASVSVTLSNSAGTSQPASASF